MKLYKKIIAGLLTVSLLACINWNYLGNLWGLTWDAAMGLVSGETVSTTALQSELNDLSVGKLLRFSEVNLNPDDLKNYVTDIWDHSSDDDKTTEENSNTENIDNDTTVNPKVTAAFEHNKNVYYDVNPKARDKSFKNDLIIEGPKGKKGLSNVNNTMNKAHAEIGAMNQSQLAGNKGGYAVLRVGGAKICNYCRSDIKKMAMVLELNHLTVIEEVTGVTYEFDEETNDFLNISEGGKRWE